MHSLIRMHVRNIFTDEGMGVHVDRGTQGARDSLGFPLATLHGVTWWLRAAWRWTEMS